MTVPANNADVFVSYLAPDYPPFIHARVNRNRRPDAYGHRKTIAHCKGTRILLDKTDAEPDECVVPIENFIKVGVKRHWARQPKVRVLA
ncbi:MAG: hypothetical protein AB7E24_12460 [Novosphingobium sp.]